MWRRAAYLGNRERTESGYRRQARPRYSSDRALAMRSALAASEAPAALHSLIRIRRDLIPKWTKFSSSLTFPKYRNASWSYSIVPSSIATQRHLTPLISYHAVGSKPPFKHAHLTRGPLGQHSRRSPLLSCWDEVVGVYSGLERSVCSCAGLCRTPRHRCEPAIQQFIRLCRNAGLIQCGGKSFDAHKQYRVHC